MRHVITVGAQGAEEHCYHPLMSRWWSENRDGSGRIVVDRCPDCERAWLHQGHGWSEIEPPTFEEFRDGEFRPVHIILSDEVLDSLRPARECLHLDVRIWRRLDGWQKFGEGCLVTLRACRSCDRAWLHECGECSLTRPMQEHDGWTEVEPPTAEGFLASRVRAPGAKEAGA